MSTDPRYAALAQAASTGQPVTIDSLTTADSETQALPDGTLANTTTVMPTRMQNPSGAWEDIDPTLQVDSNGSISTTATPNGLTLSNGGTGALVTASDPSGGSMSLTLPVSLPTPTLNGASATYTDIYPGISLTVTAQPTGGFSEVFEVDNAAAEAQAQSLQFTTQLSGLTMSQDPDGSFDLVDDSTGQTFMDAPSAIMWDSATSGAAANDLSDDFETVTNQTSSAAGPGLGANTGPLQITTSGSTLSLDGAADQLDTSAPTYPLYLDPTWTEPNASGGTNNYTEAQSGCAGVANWDDVSQPGAGYNDINGDGNCPGYGKYESFFDIDTSNLNSSDSILSATMKINEVYSADDSCGEGTENIAVDWTGGINAGTDWNSRPAPITTVSEPISTTAMKTDGNADGTMCSGGVVPGNFPVTSAIAANAAANGTHITLGLSGDESGTWMSLERFNDNPSVYTLYDLAPNTPDTLSASPTPVTSITSNGDLETNACPSSSNPGYLGIGNIGGKDIAILSARLTSPIAAAQMNATFALDDVTTGATSSPTSSGWAASGANVSVETPALTNGDEYSWSTTAWDQYLHSKPSATCYFTADTTPPTNPAITKSSWPALSSGKTSTTDAGTAGTFTVSASDAISGVAGYYYSIDADSVPSAGGTYQTGTTIDYTPASWGAHTLYVQSLDNAGNLSAVSSYSFYVPWNPAAAGVNGSVVGGKVPDFVTNPSTGSNAGDLVMVPGDANPDTIPTVISPAADSPDGTAWTNYQVSHDGSFSNNPGFDDLWAFQNSTDNLYLYLNNASGTPFETTANHNDITKADVDLDASSNAMVTAQGDTDACVTTSTGSCSTYDDTSWADTTQILAPGDLYLGDPNTDASTGAVDTTAHTPGLLTVENGSLWYYQGKSGPDYLSIVEQLGTTGWNNTTLIGTTTTGSGSSTKTYLWARLNTSSSTTNGEIVAYPITFDPAGNLRSLETPTSGNGTEMTLPDAANNDAGTTSDLPSTAYPELYAWDMHNTGNSDLIATTPSGSTIDWPSTGSGQFGDPESLAAATSTDTITIPSAGTDYPSGTTWDNGTATLSFDQGQLTVTEDSSGKVVTQYGQNEPGAYLTLQTDGNLVIYSSSGAVVWALNRAYPSAAFAGGDALTLSGSTLALSSSTGTNLWTAEAGVPTTTAITGMAAYTAADSDLAITVGAGTIDTGHTIATGTSPSITDTGSGTYEAAVHGTNGDLWTYNSNGTYTDTGHAMAAGTDPAIAPMPSNGWITAFQATGGALETLTNTGTLVNTTQGMAAGTSPSICTNPAGGWDTAFQANTGNLYLYNANGTTTNTAQGMNTTTSPSITCLTTSGAVAAFQANTNGLYTYDDNNATTTIEPLGMEPGNSPAITALTGGQWEIAFEANTGILWTFGGAPDGGNTTQPLAAGTNPSITATNGLGYALAWQSASNTLTAMASATTGDNPVNTGNPMNSTTSPTLAP